jgi:hypothetical protein
MGHDATVGVLLNRLNDIFEQEPSKVMIVPDSSRAQLGRAYRIARVNFKYGGPESPDVLKISL